MTQFLLLSAFFVNCYAAITNQPGDIVVNTGENATIQWQYDNPSGLNSLTWTFTDTSGTAITIMIQSLSTGTAAPQNGFSCVKNSASNGGITIINVIPSREGTYSLTAMYLLEATDTDSVKVSLAGCSCECNCTDCKTPCQAVDGVALPNSVTTDTVVLMVWFIIFKGNPAATVGPFAAQTLLIGVDVAVNAVSLILGIVGAAAFYEEDCQKCDCDCDCTCEDCETCLILSIVSICVAVIGAIVCILVIRFCGKDSAGGGGQGRGRSDEGPINTGIKTKPKESHEMIPAVQHKIEDTSSAGAVSRQDVHLERRPMPAIPSHNRGLSANMEDPKRLPDVDRDLPDGRSKKLEPLDSDRDNPEKKKKKKKKKKDSEWSENETTGLNF